MKNQIKIIGSLLKRCYADAIIYQFKFNESYDESMNKVLAVNRLLSFSDVDQLIGENYTAIMAFRLAKKITELSITAKLCKYGITW